MHLKILKCSNSTLWYAKHIGEVFKVRQYPIYGEWLVTASDGYSNIVKVDDCEVVNE